MATPAQIAANRLNAQKSTGPRTEAGKSVARFNALKHTLDAESVIIPGEDPAEYDALVSEYHAEFQPTAPSDTFHVDTMIRADWNKRRLQRVESELYRTVLAESGGDNLVTALLSGTPAAKLLTRVQRQIVSFERAWYRAHTALTAARRAAEQESDDAFEAFLDRACTPPPLPKLASFPEIAQSAAPAARSAPMPRPEPPSDPALRL